MYFFLFLSSLFPSLVFAQNKCIVPPSPGPATDYTGNLNWTLGSTVTIQWVTNYPAWTLALIQQYGASINLTSGYNSAAVPQETSFTWNVTTDYNFITQPVFYVNIYESTGVDGHGFTCHYVNIIAPTPPSSTSSSTSRLPPSSTHSSTSSATSSPSSSALAAKQGISTGAKIGIAFAVIIIVITASVAGLVLWKRARRSNAVRQAGNGPVYLKEDRGENAKPALSQNEVVVQHELENRQHLPSAPVELRGEVPNS